MSASDLFEPTAAEKAYDASAIEVLEGLEPVRKRPGMYIGGTDERALHHLVAEVLDNSMDEAVAGHASRIEVELSVDGCCLLQASWCETVTRLRVLVCQKARVLRRKLRRDAIGEAVEEALRRERRRRVRRARRGRRERLVEVGEVGEPAHDRPRALGLVEALVHARLAAREPVLVGDRAGLLHGARLVRGERVHAAQQRRRRPQQHRSRVASRFGKS